MCVCVTQLFLSPCLSQASNGQWYQMNDSTVAVSDIRSVLNQQAYVLFYIRYPSPLCRPRGPLGSMREPSVRPSVRVS